jgi:hypothetical protein
MSLPPSMLLSKNDRSADSLFTTRLARKGKQSLETLTKNWGSPRDVSLYLSRCQVDTSESLVRRVWEKWSARSFVPARLLV